MNADRDPAVGCVTGTILGAVMWMIIILSALTPKSCSAQRTILDWEEHADGILGNFALRLVPTSRPARFAIFMGGSLLWETVFDKAHAGDYAQGYWDVGNRALGYLETDAVLYVARHPPTLHRALLIASSVAIAADWSTTADGLRRGFVEHNPILGPHPPLTRLRDYDFVLLCGNLVLGSVLPRKVRDPWLAFVSGFFLDAARNNVILGAHFTVHLW